MPGRPQTTIQFAARSNAKPRGAHFARGTIQRAWKFSDLLNHESAGILGPAIDVFTTAMKYTEGPGVALYKLAISHPKFDVEFIPDERGEKGPGGTTLLVFKDTGEALIGHHVASNTIVTWQNLAEQAYQRGLKLRIAINPQSALNSSVGRAINTLAHEYGVHAAEY